jgi:hypothetical protein
MENWQIQCCGEPFAVGSTVDWTVHPVEDRDLLGTVLGLDRAATVDVEEDHHSEEELGSSITGEVVRIDAVRCRYGPGPDDDGVSYPVMGSTVLTPVSRADGWETDVGDLWFAGYLVVLEPDSERAG